MQTTGLFPNYSHVSRHPRSVRVSAQKKTPELAGTTGVPTCQLPLAFRRTNCSLQQIFGKRQTETSPWQTTEAQLSAIRLNRIGCSRPAVEFRGYKIPLPRNPEPSRQVIQNLRSGLLIFLDTTVGHAGSQQGQLSFGRYVVNRQRRNLESKKVNTPDVIVIDVNSAGLDFRETARPPAAQNPVVGTGMISTLPHWRVINFKDLLRACLPGNRSQIRQVYPQQSMK